MNRDQISIREVVAEPSLPNDLSQCNEFEAVEYSSTENFLQIRELLAQGRSIAHAIQSERVSPMITGLITFAFTFRSFISNQFLLIHQMIANRSTKMAITHQ